MNTIADKEFGGERPLYKSKDLRLERVTIHVGESSVKESANIEAVDCRFEGKYTLWCIDHCVVRNCLFVPTSRSSVWHSKDFEMYDSVVDAPKFFREMQGVKLRNVRMTDAQETFWDCNDIDIDGLIADNADYIFSHCTNVKVSNMQLHGNYSFQHAKNVEIHNCDMQSKDSLWESENVTVYDSYINGEYLGWHSKNLRLVNCRIGGGQTLCYADNLILENCTFNADADLAFEYSTVHATINGPVTSVKNPTSGSIHAGSIGEIIIDNNLQKPGDCVILVDK